MKDTPYTSYCEMRTRIDNRISKIQRQLEIHKKRFLQENINDWSEAVWLGKVDDLFAEASAMLPMFAAKEKS